MSSEQLTIDNDQLPKGYKQTEVGLIPEDWEVCSVGHMGEVVTGKALAVNAPGQHRPYLRTKNVFDGRIDIDDVLTMPMTDAQFTHFMLMRGDVLLNEGQSLELVGRCAMYQDEYPEPCAMQNQLLRFRARVDVSAAFASHLFRYCQQTGIFARIALQTTSVAHLGSKRFERLLLPWPKSEAEQRSIAQALSDVDRLIAALERAIAKKQAIKTATMQQLLTGKKRLPGFGEGKGYKETEVGIIPDDWILKPLEKVSAFITKGSTPTTYGFSWTQDGILFLRSECVSENGLDLSQSMFISEKAHSALSRSELRSGDLLITITGNVGRVVYLDEDFGVGNMNQHIARVRINDNGVCSKFVYYYLNQTIVRRAFNAITTGQAYPQISLKQVRDAFVPMPLLEEQRAIATVLSDMDAEIAALESRLTKTQSIKQGMMQQLLTGKVRLKLRQA
ncbi:restriction endonuclease subunit S [Pantanalinema sp. GBBB05]|uniref:restriction endonuclease subunit S n=1 Tax=Pantanalinema sp. GBBB05 TaxID=2604139 RepID=UPI001DA6BC2A|nr:restriction endonuclease subunit S [Pantanalinema sp. GBBB05]